VTFGALGLPLPVFFRFITFFAALVPMMGSPFVWFPFVLFLFFKGSVVKAIILLVLGLGVIGMVDNVIDTLLLVSILGGLQLCGISGIFLGPVIVTLLFVFVDILAKMCEGQSGDKSVKV